MPKRYYKTNTNLRRYPYKIQLTYRYSNRGQAALKFLVEIVAARGDCPTIIAGISFIRLWNNKSNSFLLRGLGRASQQP